MHALVLNWIVLHERIINESLIDRKSLSDKLNACSVGHIWMLKEVQSSNNFFEQPNLLPNTYDRTLTTENPRVEQYDGNVSPNLR